MTVMISWLFVGSFSHLLVRPFVGLSWLFVGSLSHWLVRPFVCSAGYVWARFLTGSFTRSFVKLVICGLVFSLARLPVRLFSWLFVGSFSHLLARPFVRSTRYSNVYVMMIM